MPQSPHYKAAVPFDNPPTMPTTEGMTSGDTVDIVAAAEDVGRPRALPPPTPEPLDGGAVESDYRDVPLTPEPPAPFVLHLPVNEMQLTLEVPDIRQLVATNPAKTHPMIANLPEGSLEAFSNGVIEEVGVTVANPEGVVRATFVTDNPPTTPEVSEVPAADACLDADTGDVVGDDVAQKLILHEFNSTLIAQRPQDGYVNATAMCQAHGKLIGHWSQNAATQEYLKALSTVIGIPITQSPGAGGKSLVVVRQGGAPSNQGTWVHPQVAIHIALWCSPAFSVWATEHLLNWMRSTPAAPAHDFSDPLATAKLYIEAEERRRQAATKLAESEELIGLMGNNIEQLGARASQLAETVVVKEAELADGVREFRREPRQSVFGVCHRIGARGSHMGQAAGVPPHSIERGVEPEPA